MDSESILRLRRVINENTRVQRGGGNNISYIDISKALNDVLARQNHVVFGRRGCGKTLLLHYSVTKLDSDIRAVYLNCEDFKRHSFPNVLIEILDSLFGELEKHLTGWFGRKKRSREIIAQIRRELRDLKSRADSVDKDIKEVSEAAKKNNQHLSAGAKSEFIDMGASESISESTRKELEAKYRVSESKIGELDSILPRLKQQIREFFEISSSVKAVFLQIDDLYHLMRADQPLVMDYVHRLCKDVPLYFKVATLRHASVLYADRHGQPIGAQERHDYQPINIDFTFVNLRKTIEQNRKILGEYGRLAGMTEQDVIGLFKGNGFDRLIIAGGGVPRDCLSLFLEVVESVQPPNGDGRIGKDEVRILSREIFERRIEELKQDSQLVEQEALIKGIYIIREFCIGRKTNVILVQESLLQKNDRLRDLLYRLLDYRIIHTAGSALTHKSHEGSFHAFAIDIGCYAHMRVLEGRFNEIDLNSQDAKEKMRSAPILDEQEFASLWGSLVGKNIESALANQEDTGEA